MFQPGDQPRFLLEAPREVGMIGVFRQDHLDRHVAPQRWLKRAIHDPEPARAHPFAEFIAVDHPLCEHIHS